MTKKPLILLFLLILLGTFSTMMYGVVTKTVPTDYATVAEAVTYLNGLGALTDSYVIDVDPGHTEILTGRITLTATGTASYSITIKKASAGTNPLLTAYTGTGTGATADGMFALSGSDYVTIDGIDLYDPNTLSNTTMMEYGYGLFKASVTDGAQYNTIKNCTITLNRNNLASASGPLTEGAACITMPNSLLSAPGTALTPTDASGTNSYNKFYANYLTNANYGIAMVGYAAPSPFTLGDTGNDVGGSGFPTGNTIVNYGGGTGATVPSAAIRGNNQWGWNASYNVINNNNGSGVNHPNTLRGIYAQAGTSANCDITYNTVTIKGGGTTSQLSAIECAIGSTAAGNTVNINNNTVTGCEYSTATTGTFYGIYNSSTPNTLNMNGNVVNNNSLAGTGMFHGIYSSASAVNLNANNNQVSLNTKTGASGTIYAMRFSTSIISATNNQIHNITIPNTTGTSAATIYGIYNLVSATYENYSDNQIYNCSIGGSNTSTSSIIQGIYTYTVAGSTKLLNNNEIFGLQYAAAGAASVIGIRNNVGTVEIGKNMIYNLSTAGSAGIASGISIEGSTVSNVHNNMIHGLQAPGNTTAATVPSIQGIRITAGTTNNIHYNSCLLNHNGANAYFSTAGLYISGGTTNEIRNNIFVNKCTPGASGRSVAVWKTSAGTTNFGANSNKNIYWTGADPDATRPIGYIVTTAYPTLAEYKTALVDRDQGSYAEDVPFLSDSRVVDLHINDSVETRVEGNAIYLAAYDTDFDNEDRSDTNPDIGADEGEFTPVVAAPGIPVYSSPGNGTSGIAINAPLTWSANAEGGTPTSYDVSFDEADGSTYYETVGASPSNPPKQWGKTYFWKVKAINGQGEAEGDVWSFSTADGVPTLTAPGNGTTDVSPYVAFTWNAVAGASGYKIKIGTSSGASDVANMTFSAVPSYTHPTPLAYLGNFFWSVYAVNGAQEVQSLEWSFRVMDDPTVDYFPFEESFDGATFPPINWSRVKISGTGSGLWDRVLTGSNPTCSPHSGAGMARYNSFSMAAGTNGILVTPPISFGTNPYKLTFWMYRDAGYLTYDYEGVKVWYNTLPNLTGAQQLAYIHRAIGFDPVVPAAGWYEYIIDLPTAKAKGIGFIAFEGISQFGNNMFIDDFVVTEIPADPTFQITPISKDFGDVQIGTSSAPQVFNIKNAGGGTLTIQSISLTGDDIVHYTLENLNGSNIPLGQGQSINVTVTFNPGTVGTKNAFLKVVDDLTKTDNYATLVGVGVDKTIYDLPYLQTLLETPQARFWQQFNIGAGLTDRWSISTTSNAGGGSPEWHCLYQGINPGTTRLVSPPISITGRSELIVKYRQQLDDYGVGCTYKLRAGYAIDSFFDVWTQASASNITYPAEEKVFTLGPDILVGHDLLYICWEIEGNLLQFDHWYIDNIKFLTTNTEIGQVVASGPTAFVDVPEILVDGVPVSPEVQFAGLSGDPLINVSASYGVTSDPLTSERMVLTIDGGNLAGVTVTFVHGLGFTPGVLAYQIGDGQPMIITNPGDWTDFTAYFTITGKGVKGPNTLKIIFPKDRDDTLPVELSSFTAVVTSDLFVRIAWTAQSETNHAGYNLFRAEDGILESALQMNPSLISSENGEVIGSQVNYAYTDTEAFSNMIYYYWLESRDLDGTSHFYGPLMVTLGDPTQEPQAPAVVMATKLLAAFPNPFNPSTNLRYSLKEPGKVRMDIYNLKGQKIRTFNTEHYSPGYYRITWDGKDDNGQSVSSGIYMYRMNSGSYSSTKKMILAK